VFFFFFFFFLFFHPLGFFSFFVHAPQFLRVEYFPPPPQEVPIFLFMHPKGWTAVDVHAARF